MVKLQYIQKSYRKINKTDGDGVAIPKITSYDVIFEYFQRKNHKVPPKSKL